MPYVMVPVPEEHVEDVMQFILRAQAQASMQPWDGDSITQFFKEVDEASRSLLAFVSRASVDGGDLADAEAARRIQLTVREVLSIRNELDARVKKANRPSLITVRTVTERLPNGRMTDKRVLQMDPEIAELVRVAEREESVECAHPLGVPSD